MEKKLKELRENGVNVYSFSKLGSFNNCEYEFYNSYINKKETVPNIYTLIGSEVHNGIEQIYKKEINSVSFKENFENKLIECELLGYNFPNESIGDSFKKDMSHFMDNFNEIEGNKLIEKLIVFEIDGIWLQGYIDCIIPSDKGKPYVDIYDWKTSSKFTGSKLTDAGRQLLLYKIGLEQSTNMKVDKVQWFMVKYVNVCFVQKNGKVKKKMCNRGKWVSDIKNYLEKDLTSLDMSELEISFKLDDAITNNNLDQLPEEIKNKYWLEDCIVEYDTSDEKIEEVKNFVKETVAKIENKVASNSKWKPIEISKYNSFYCSVLCGHRKRCEYYKEFLEKNKDGFKKKQQSNEMDELFS